MIHDSKEPDFYHISYTPAHAAHAHTLHTRTRCTRITKYTQNDIEMRIMILFDHVLCEYDVNAIIQYHVS